jgi:D-lactate dehydrogenase
LDIFFYEAFDEEEKAIRKFLPQNIDAGFTWKAIQETNHSNPPAALISTRTQSVLPTKWAPDLQGILSRSTGFDHLNRYMKETGEQVSCGNLPLYCNRSVAEQALLMWLALMRKLSVQQKQFKQFHRDGLTGLELSTKKLLVVGVGNIGYEIVRIGRGLDMVVYGVDLVLRHQDVDYRPIDDILSEADIIVCAMNLTAENMNYFGYNRLRKAKRGALFINIARGEMSPSADLLRLLKEGILGGIALDVYNEESRLATALRKNKKDNSVEVQATLELQNYPNVILTPHNAFNTEESVERKAKQSVEQVIQFLNTGTFKWNVE